MSLDDKIDIALAKYRNHHLVAIKSKVKIDQRFELDVDLLNVMVKNRSLIRY